jgi:SAM-dependent methyltransferase
MPNHRRRQIAYVKGIDLSPAEVREAQRRYSELKARDARESGAGVVVLFYCCCVARVWVFNARLLSPLSPAVLASQHDAKHLTPPRPKGMALECEFEQCDHLGDRHMPELEPFDVVTVMFAIHYFFATEAALTMLLRNAADSLRDGAVVADLVCRVLCVCVCVGGGGHVLITTANDGRFMQTNQKTTKTTKQPKPKKQAAT